MEKVKEFFNKCVDKVKSLKFFQSLNEILLSYKTFMSAGTVEEAGYKSEVDAELKKNIKPAVRFGLGVIGLGIGFFIVWGGLAPLDSAAIAEGFIAISGNHKTIQHLEGGVIEKINIKEGNEVEEGEILLVLNDTAAKARLQMVKGQFRAAKAIEARLIAERDGKIEISFDQEMFGGADAEEDKIKQTQLRQFDTRQKALGGQIEVLSQRIAQHNEQVKGLEAQQKAVESQIELVKEEVKSVETLLEKGLARKPRLLELKRTLEGLEGRRGEIRAGIAGAKETIAETQLQMLNVENDFQRDIAEELKSVQVQVLDLTEQYNAAKDVLVRTKIKAPDSGVITDLQYHTIGGVITPGSKILDIVPQGAKLIVEARVRTQDIASIYPGLVAKVQLGAYKSRLIPRLMGKVIYVSADKFTDERTGMQYYTARIEIDDKEIDSINAEIKLYPGMPATVFIVKGTRTFLQYLIGPIRDSFFKAFKEV